MNHLRTTFAVMGLLILPTVAAAGESLESALRSVADEQIKELSQLESHDGGACTVGALKWIISKDRKKSDSYGPLNQGLATRLETALLQAQTGLTKFKVRVVRNASAVAATMDGMTYNTETGRARFFEASGREVKYPLYVGSEKVTPDVFYSGRAVFDRSFQRLELFIYRFTRKNPGDEVLIARRTVEVDLDILADSGESFSLRSSAKSDGSGLNFKRGKDLKPSAESLDATPEVISEAVSLAREKLDDPKPQSPSEDRTFATLPVKLEILYDGVVQKPFFQNVGNSRKMFVTEPQTRQAVTFRLIREDNESDVRYGVVLRVNGLNTVNKETLAPVDCRKWVLVHKAPPLLLEGFVFTDKLKEVFPFKVATPEESINEEINFGAEFGQISMTIFREGAAPTASAEALNDDELASDKDVITRRGVQIATGASEAVVRAALDTENAKRGAIVVDSQSKPGNATIVKPFKSLKLVDTVTITYRPRLAE